MMTELILAIAFAMLLGWVLGHFGLRALASAIMGGGMQARTRAGRL